MAKYNLRSIMRRAWEIKREDSQYIFAICLKLAWAEAKAPKEYKNVIIETYYTFNFRRRYNNPWVALVDKQGRLDFSRGVGAYAGAYGKGRAGQLYVFAPVEGQVYAYGQKDYRGHNGGYQCVRFAAGKFIPVQKSELLFNL